MSMNLVSYLDALNASQAVDEAHGVAVRFFEQRGFNWLIYGFVRKDSDGFHDVPDKFYTYPEQWAELYSHERLYRHDPTIHHCLSNLEPFHHGVETITETRYGKPAQQMFEEIRSWGAHSGVLVPLRAGLQQRPGGLILAGEAPMRQHMQLWRESGLMLQVAAYYLDAHLHHLLHAHRAARTGLSRRERECLLWLSRGLRNDRIAERLGVTNATVEMHLANARRKLGTATREQALAKAVLLGLVDP